jgi:hypothetical protein
LAEERQSRLGSRHFGAVGQVNEIPSQSAMNAKELATMAHSAAVNRLESADDFP